MYLIMLRFLITLVSDWLIALLVASFLVWFALMQPVFSVLEKNNDHLNISLNNLQSDVGTLTQFYAPRTIAFDNLNSTARFIQKQFSVLGHTEFQPYWTFNRQFNNVILQLGPQTEEVFVIGAHYDAEDNSLDSEGNASGVATLMELARQLAKHQDKLPIQVQFVAYPLSQGQSLRQFEIGSFNHAEKLQRDLKKVYMMISLDSVGRFSSREGSQKYPFSFMSFLYPSKGNYISLLGRIQDFEELRHIKKSFARSSLLPLYSFNTNEDFPEITSSDHHSYWEKGFPALLITDTAQYRNVSNESLEVVDRLDYNKMAMLVQGLYQVVMDSESVLSNVELVQQSSATSDQLQ